MELIFVRFLACPTFSVQIGKINGVTFFLNYTCNLVVSLIFWLNFFKSMSNN